MSDELIISPTAAWQAFNHFQFAEKDSHKGQNGKVMLIGGSELFHAASRWSLDTVAKLVDMVFYSSVPANNELIQEAKKNFWNGIVVPRSEVDSYLAEADVILIGPGMTRQPETAEITNRLLQQWPTKKWVIDAGALQMVDPSLIPVTSIITPHQQEWSSLLERARLDAINLEDDAALKQVASHFQGATILLKGRQDIIFSPQKVVRVTGGNVGLTKGGTGDALAGLVAGIYVNVSAVEAAVMSSITIKQASLAFASQVGPFFDTTELVAQIPQTLWQLLKDKNAHTS